MTTHLNLTRQHVPKKIECIEVMHRLSRPLPPPPLAFPAGTDGHSSNLCGTWGRATLERIHAVSSGRHQPQRPLHPDTVVERRPPELPWLPMVELEAGFSLGQLVWSSDPDKKLSLEFIRIFQR